MLKRIYDNRPISLLKKTTIFLAIVLSLPTKNYAQDLTLQSASYTLSLSDLENCKDDACFLNAIKSTSSALQNAKQSATLVQERRKDLTVNITEYNAKVAIYYAEVDSLKKAYQENKKETEILDKAFENLHESDKMIQGMLASNVTTTNPSTTRTRPPPNYSYLEQKQSRDIDLSNLKEKRRFLNEDYRKILAIKGTLEKKRLRYVAEGTLLNKQMQETSLPINEAYKKLLAVYDFALKFDGLLKEKYHFSKTMNAGLMNECNLLLKEIADNSTPKTDPLSKPVSTRLD